MHSHSMIRGLRAALLLALTSALAAPAAFARPGPGQPRTRRSGFKLLASTELPMNVNRTFCGINNLGQVLFVGSVTSPTRQGLFVGSTSAVQKVVISGDPLPSPLTGSFSPRSISLRTTVISLSRSLREMNELIMRSASISRAQFRFASEAVKVSK